MGNLTSFLARLGLVKPVLRGVASVATATAITLAAYRFRSVCQRCGCHRDPVMRCSRCGAGVACPNRCWAK